MRQMDFSYGLLGLPEPVPVVSLVPLMEPTFNAIHMGDCYNSWREATSAETSPDLIAHLFAEFCAARRSLMFGDVETVEDVEVFQDRVTVACHRQDAKQLARRPARACDFPPAYGVRAASSRKATQVRHLSTRPASADRFTQIRSTLPYYRPYT